VALPSALDRGGSGAGAGVIAGITVRRGRATRRGLFELRGDCDQCGLFAAAEQKLEVGGVACHVPDGAEHLDPGRRRPRVVRGHRIAYVGPGHTPILYAGTEVVEFSPTEELRRTMEVVTTNMEEKESASS
jgi:hypothetical protein